MLRDIVVPMTGTPADGDALETAIDLAARHNGHLTVLEIVNLPMPAISPWGFTADLSVGDVYTTLRARAHENVERLRARLQREAVPAEVCLVEAPLLGPSGAAARSARYADLAVVAGAAGLGGDAKAEVADTYFGSLLFESGRPVLVVPRGAPHTGPLRHVVVAWRPTPEAARALHDALPLLREAETVDVVIVDPIGGEMGEGDEPGAAIARHLARHGIKVEVVVRQAEDRAISGVLLDHVARTGADLLVVGGYGHSKLREWVMGGVTRELLAAAPLPVLYAH
ncbi:universal stress protein [Coralloluteibacterium thermophilus]|uniref:Universal stress protein n=1 Tax=Coralloluteibacterium thermophilum TaxID=2707049 RepID=A0ABV9NJ14_9GAMM